ncbi:PIG-L deacetylase family protein [Endozoicomonas arenosclerae]|uniref:PIG-L deacetylase family protein n=1 Tax=Endozoicomonas arenosclerae TaxID=1633495 RepID=UPI0007801CDF|nr:PIG-L family deacetylase [Endozoicomonas arenosclerae]
MKPLFRALKLLGILAVVTALFAGMYLHPSWLWIVFFLVAYILHGLLFADHIYYRRQSDYKWKIAGKDRQEAIFNGPELLLPESLRSGDHSVFLKVKVKARLSGRLFDPALRVLSEGQRYAQYFERGCKGFRYINLTPAIEGLKEAEALSLRGRHCHFSKEDAELVAFKKPDLVGKKVLYVSPHADDAEIAAFGLYKNTDSLVVTITAGEAEPETFGRYFSNSSNPNEREQAAILKGRVRAWDSITVPQWAGLKSDQVVQLGYFCKHLKKMHESPEVQVTSEYAGVADTRIFREFNTVKLASDSHGTSSWQQLVDDLAELISGFQPDYVVTPHIHVDAHQDHQYSTIAVREAVAKSDCADVFVMFYANHLANTDMHPYGPSGSLVSLPPVTGDEVNLSGAFSFSLNEVEQKDKIMALEMNHDLRRPVRWKKWLRKRLQKTLIKRYQPDYGEDEFFRKAVRANELFFY